MANHLPRLYAPVSLPGVRGGTPLTLDRAFDVLETLVSEQAAAARAYDHAFDRWEAVRSRAARAKWRKIVDESRNDYARFSSAVDRLENQVENYGAALVEREQEDERAAGRRVSEDSQPEWQFGLSYVAARRGSNIDLNVDIRRVDGQPMTRSDAVEQFHMFLDMGMAPEGIEVAKVMYRSPEQHGARGEQFRTGGHSVDELTDAFNSVMTTVNFTDWRVGGIE